MTVRPPSPTPLRWPARVRLRTKHAVRLGRDVRQHGAQQRLWWLLPCTVLLLLLALAITTSTAALPVAVYTIF